MPGYHVHTLPANRPEMGQTAGNGRANYRVNNSPHSDVTTLCIVWNEMKLEMICEWAGFNNHSGRLN